MLHRIGVILFSLYYWPTSFAIMFVGAVYSIGLRVMGLPYTKVYFMATRPWFAACVPLSRTRLRIRFHPDFQPERPAVYTQNHVNLIDGHVAAHVIPQGFSGVMNAWQFKIPIYGWLMSVSKGIAVHRGRREETIRQISEAAADRRSIGMSVLTFPEGHRTRDGEILPFHRGVFLMARNAQMPVVPITTKGLSEVNRKGSLLFFPGKTVDVLVGPHLDTQGISDEEIPKFAERVRQYMVHCFQHDDWPESVEDMQLRLCTSETQPADATTTNTAGATA